ncbi:hypothetical protein V6N13_143641 [Hibiscus sabdariffa]
MWVHGPGSRTMFVGSTYRFQGQNRKGGEYRQRQQPSQQIGSLGYPNFYHSQTGVLGDHQQQNPMDGTLSGLKASHQSRPNCYERTITDDINSCFFGVLP